ncbi:DUF5710 domain-containing protein [Pseudomonas sp.]|uniref:DUF5710 domain-containing protein n=1 Tax=Pseudomonas sp. TaxID=306 RepID=UPI002585571C|nr:DUF5710 domain-containing protein [Pseudomonas sp.]
MTKSELFRNAHSVARNILMVSAQAYRAAFAEALRRVYAIAKRETIKAEEAAKPARVIYLDVPYSQKDKAKKAGAKWDATARSWYVYASAVPFALKAWERNDSYSARILSTTCYAA